MAIAFTKPTFVSNAPPALSPATLQPIVDALKIACDGGAGSGLDADKVQGKDLAAVAQLDYGKVLHLSADGLPEYPDSTAGTTLLETAFATVAGFSALDTSTATLTVASGELALAVGASPTTYVAATKALDVSSKTVRVKWRCAQTDLTTMEIGTSGAGTHVTKSIAGQTSGVTDITTGASFTDFEIRFNSTGNHGASPVYIDFVYVGDGTYATKLPDVSGNGNDGTVVGCTTVDTIVGKALSFNYTNNYILLDKTKAAFTGAFSFSTLVQGKARTAVQYIISRNASSGSRGFYTYLDANNRPVFAVTADGTTFTTVTGDAGSECTADCMLGFKFVPSVGMYIYKNGALIKSNTTSIPASVYYTTTQVMVIGIAYGLTLNPFDGWIGLPMLHNRAFSDAEFWELYQKPRAAGAPVNAASIANMIGRVVHVDGESPSIGSTFQAKFASDEYTYPASCTSAPTTNAGNVIVNSGAIYDTFLAFDGTTGIAWRGSRAHGTGAPTWQKVWSSASDGNGGEPPAPKPTASAVPGQWVASGVNAYTTPNVSGTYAVVAFKSGLYYSCKAGVVHNRDLNTEFSTTGIDAMICWRTA